MNQNIKPFFTFLFVILCFFSRQAFAQTAAIQTTNTPLEIFVNQQFGTGNNLGWSFTVGTNPITLTALGLYDAGSDGLSEAHQVGIWNSGGLLLSTATISPGTGATLSAGYRYNPITPIVLEAGQTYVIGALYGAHSADKYIMDSRQTIAPQITFVASQQNISDNVTTPPFGFPGGNPGRHNEGFFGPNFQFNFCVTDPVVTTNADAGAGSLRQAIIDACPGSTITFDMNQVTSPISLSNGQIIIDKNLTVQGPGASLLNVQNTMAQSSISRVFNINAGVTAAISNLTISGGNCTGDAINGGGILNKGILTVTNSVVSGNSSTSYGGGIATEGGSVEINNSTIIGNTSYIGGGLISAGIVNLANSTVSGNLATLVGGGIHVSSNSAIVNVTNSTISGNTAPSGGGIYTNVGTVNLINSTISSNQATNGSGGGITNFSTVSSKNSIIAGNTANAAPDFSGTVNSQGNNLTGKTDGSSGWVASDFTGTTASPIDPLLGLLANNGGPTFTMALLPGSPAIDAGTSTNAPPTDQRGIGRVGAVDIGAFELQTLATNTSITSSPNPSCFGNSVTFTATVTSGGNPVGGGTVDFKEGSTVLATANVNDAGHASFNISSLIAGPHTIQAVYNGTAAFLTSNGSTTQTVNPLPTISNITGVSTCYGSIATLTASSTASSPSFIWSEIAGHSGGGGAGKVLSTNASYTTDALYANTGYNLKVTDGVTGCSSSLIVVDVTVNPLPVISPASLPPGQVGVSYSQDIIVSGGTGPYTLGFYTSPPPGISMNGTGLLSGKPTLAGVNTFVVYFADSKGCGGYKEYSITVAPAAPSCILTCPGNITVNNKTGLCGAYVSYPAATNSGNCGTLTYSIKSGSWFAVGTTTVTVNASGGTSCSFTVTVKDAQKPVIVCPSDITVTAAANACTKQVSFSINAVDNCPGVVVTSVPASGSVFNAGTTTVTATATDLSGNKTTSTFTVKVKESQPPVIKVVTTPIVLLWPANGSYQTINVSQCVLSVTDNCSSIPVSNVKITKVTSDEADNASGNDDGNTTKDIKIASDCKSVDLRRERNSKSNGRVYTIYLSVTDAGGNTGTASFKVIAPVSQGGTTAVDNGSACTVSSYCSGNNYRPGTGTTEEQEPIVKNEIPEGFMMEQNYPNPFNAVTTIRYAIPVDAKVSLGVYNQVGQRVAQLTEGKMSAGNHQASFDATKLTAGIYLYRLLAVDADGKLILLTKKMIVAK